MKKTLELISDLIRAASNRIRAAFLAILVFAVGPAFALTINLTYDPDSTFTNAGLYRIFATV